VLGVPLLHDINSVRLLSFSSEAVRAARTSSGHDTSVVLDLPVTAERIRMACPDAFTERVLGSRKAAAEYQAKTSH
jgi:hypothetical protein